MIAPPLAADEQVAGVDGFRGGWVVATVTGRGRVSIDIHGQFSAVRAATQPCHRIGVDMPIALPVEGLRESDEALRAMLGPAARSLFWTPTREAIAQADHASAVVVNKARGGKGPSAQGWGLAARIREVRAELLSNPDDRIFEAHPESSFLLLARTVAGGEPSPIEPLASKRSARGVGQRLALLRHWVPIDDMLGDLPAGPAIDDVLDAIAAAWSAARVATDTAEWFGPRTIDDEGLLPAVAV